MTIPALTFSKIALIFSASSRVNSV